MIQPFMENAFFHAFNVKGEGVIHVLVAKEGQKLICEVADNGDGMDMAAFELEYGVEGRAGQAAKAAVESKAGADMSELESDKLDGLSGTGDRNAGHMVGAKASKVSYTAGFRADDVSCKAGVEGREVG